MFDCIWRRRPSQTYIWLIQINCPTLPVQGPGIHPCTGKRGSGREGEWIRTGEEGGDPRGPNRKYPTPTAGIVFPTIYRKIAYRRPGPGISSHRRRGPDMYWSVLRRPAVIPDILRGARRPQNVRIPGLPVNHQILLLKRCLIKLV